MPAFELAAALPLLAAHASSIFDRQVTARDDPACGAYYHPEWGLAEPTGRWASCRCAECSSWHARCGPIWRLRNPTTPCSSGGRPGDRLPTSRSASIRPHRSARLQLRVEPRRGIRRSGHVSHRRTGAPTRRPKRQAMERASLQGGDLHAARDGRHARRRLPHAEPPVGHGRGDGMGRPAVPRDPRSSSHRSLPRRRLRPGR